MNREPRIRSGRERKADGPLATIVIGPDGRVRYANASINREAETSLTAALDALLP